MKKIAHISDIHFGANDAAVVEGLVEDIHRLAPDLVAVSGDLTQRARREEYRAARKFLRRLPRPVLVTPGNHDVPLWDVFRRFASPLGRFQKYVTRDLAPFHRSDGLAALALNTARSLTFKDGRLSHEQIALIRSRFGGLPRDSFKVLITHHPFVAPTRRPRPVVVGRAEEAIEALVDVGADLVLSGHLHVGFVGDVREHHIRVRRSILIAQAGTAASTRVRGGEPNAYNLARIEPPNVEFEVRVWDGGRFRKGLVARFVKREDGWHRRAPPKDAPHLVPVVVRD